MLTVADLERALPALAAHRSARPRDVNWGALESHFHIQFPADYKELAGWYRTFDIDNFLLVRLPGVGKEADFIGQTYEDLELVRGLAADDMTHGYVAYPGENGLFPWASSSSGDLFYWRISGTDPSQWPVVISSCNDDWTESPGGVVKFLIRLIEGDVDGMGLPDHARPNAPVEAFPD